MHHVHLLKYSVAQELGFHGMQPQTQKFCIIKILSKISRNWVKKLRYYLTILMKLYFFVIECVIEVAVVAFSDSDSAPVPKFLNPGVDPSPAIFQL